MKKVLFISNIPSPYRAAFFEELGKYVELTVLFEAKRARGIVFDWKGKGKCQNFRPIFLKDGYIEERRLDLSIFKFIKKNKYDVIFATNYSYRTELAAYLKMMLFHIPFVLEIDGGILKPESRLLYGLKTFLIKGAGRYFSPSGESDRFLQHYGVQKKDIFRYYFTSLREQDLLKSPVSNQQKKAIRKRLGLEDKKTVLFVGQVIPRKGVDVLLRALKKVDAHIQCLVVGPHPDTGYYAKMKALAGGNVVFKEFQAAKELKYYYQCADVFAFPTRYDIWGLVVNEALANGLPVVTTTQCVAGKELIQDGANGRLVEAGNASQLADAITYYLKHGCDGTVQQACLQSVRKYTIEHMAKVHVDFLKHYVQRKAESKWTTF